MSSDSRPHLLALMPPLCYLSPHCLDPEELKWRQVIEKYLRTLRNKQFCAKVGFRWGLSSQGEWRLLFSPPSASGKMAEREEEEDSTPTDEEREENSGDG